MKQEARVLLGKASASLTVSTTIASPVEQRAHGDSSGGAGRLSAAPSRSRRFCEGGTPPSPPSQPEAPDGSWALAQRFLAATATRLLRCVRVRPMARDARLRRSAVSK